MGLEHIAPKVYADRKKKVMHGTWGHLFPERGKDYFGMVRIAHGEYGDIIVVKDNTEVPSSPWWYHSLSDFADSFFSGNDLEGVYDIQVKAQVITKDDAEVIGVVSLGYREV